ncbi:zinc finger FYVE domain-containing protein 9 isoform X2 [Danio rerio]|uniref:Zinc finger FYVE domain-containing protein 9 isoform X2 n=1 Tax=Danio rerio TaxID=7955 RepID=A0AB32U4L6_DANRE
MRQAVTATLSVWGERRFGYSTLKDSSESLLDERKLRPGLKEDSVIEEKERAENEQEQVEAVLGPPSSPVEDTHQSGTTEPSDAMLESCQDQKTSDGMEASLVSGPKNIDSGRKGSLGALPVQRCSSLGTTAPQWVPDSQAPACMKCGSKFSFTKRRHHCRACGKVFCVVCCDLRYKLTHLGGKEGRVCVTCHSTLINRTLRKDQKKVWFADNVLPQSESRSANSSPIHRSVSHTQSAGLAQADVSDLRAADEVSGLSSNTKPTPPKDLPPILTSTGVKGDYTLEEKRTESSLLEELERGLAEPLVFVLNANLLAVVKIVSYVNRRCWCVMSKGMHAVGQPEVVILLQCLPEEKRFPTDIFNHFIQIYWDAQTAGKLLNHLSHSLVSRGFLGNNEHAGFVYVRPTFQSLEGLPLPAPPFLFGLLMLRAEVPWAKAFPLRLMLRLGAEYRFYPCPLFSVRFREPLFGPVNNSIMRLLVDFRFYRYTLPTVPGLVVDLEARSTCIRIPKTHHPELLKALNKSNERVLALGACFNEQADSHLICVQTADGQYQTQAISIHSQPRRDGLMVQITMETMAELRRCLRDMKDFTVTCGKLHPAERQEYVHIQWQDEEPRFNKGIVSPIDGKSMESLTNIKTHQRLEFRANGKLIRWTEVYYLLKDQHPNGLNNHTSHNRLTERLARAFCLALCQSLCLLKEDGMTKLALRVILDGQKMEFLAGSNGQRLPAPYQDCLNQSLMSVVQSNSQYQGLAACQLELIFYILEDTS